MELGYKYFINQSIFKKIIILNIIIFLLPLVSNTFLFLFNFNQISLIKYFDLHPESYKGFNESLDFSVIFFFPC